MICNIFMIIVVKGCIIGFVFMWVEVFDFVFIKMVRVNFFFNKVNVIFGSG